MIIDTKKYGQTSAAKILSLGNKNKNFIICFVLRSLIRNFVFKPLLYYHEKNILTLIILSTALTAMAQATQPCIVKQYNQKQQKTPLAGVQVEVRGAQTATSAANGVVTLQFATLKPGDRVPFRAATKAGFELMNKTAVEQWNISRDQKPFEIVLIQSVYFTQLKGKLKQSSVDSYHEKYEKARAELEKLQKEGKLKEQEYYDKLNELEDRYDSQLKNLDAYVDQFARIDLSELSEQEQQFVELAHAGRLDEAAEAYNALNAAGKYITAVENVRKLNEDIVKLEDEKAQQQEAAKTFFAVLQRQVNTLKLAGGEENYRKAGELLKRAALADTTNVEVVYEYAKFALDQQDYINAEQFLLICKNCSKNSSNLFYELLALGDLGRLYIFTYDISQAEQIMIPLLQRYEDYNNQLGEFFLSQGFVAQTQNFMGIIYVQKKDYTRAENFFTQALNSYTNLFANYPETFRSGLASTQTNLGLLYSDLHNYTKAEEYFLKALENYTLLFFRTPNEYRSDLAGIQHNLGILYDDIHDYTKAEEYYLKALENYTQLFNWNPEAFRSKYADIQKRLADIYMTIEEYAKAEDYYLKSLELYKILYKKQPTDNNRLRLAWIQFNLMSLYANNPSQIELYETMLTAVLDSFEYLYRSDDSYKTIVVGLRNRKGLRCLQNEKTDEAIELFKSAYQIDPENAAIYLADSYNKKAYEYAHQNNFAKALETIDKAIELMPKEANY